MNKSSITQVVVMVVAIAVSSWLASSLTKQQKRIVKTRYGQSKTAMGGFNKFAADIQWMFFINYCGKLKSIDDENSKEIYRRLNNIINNDPDFLKAYTIGGLMLSVRAPIKSVDILMRGANNPNLKNNSRLPFLAGFVLIQHTKDKAWNEYRKEHKDLPDRLQMAEDMFQLAIDRSSPPEGYYISSLMRTRAKRLKVRGKYKGIEIVNLQQAYVLALFNYWKKNSTSIGQENFTYDTITIPDIEKRILAAIKYAKSENPDSKQVKKTIKLVKKHILMDKHLCSKCLAPFNPGDKFCSSCGVDVVLYGTCKKCGKVLKGTFCSDCGTKAK